MTTPRSAYLAPDGFLNELVTELGTGVLSTHGRLVVSAEPARAVAWAANVWRSPQWLEIASIGDAARQLKAIQRNWVPYAVDHHRRTALIVEKLPKVSAKPLVFPAPAPTAPLGSFTLIEPNRMIASADCSSPFANGEPQFVENRQGPPSRAYLKLWEALTVIGERPGPGDTCLDLGSSPGGWTWVLAELGATVISVDKAPIDDRLIARSNVSYRSESAFAIDPRRHPPVEWLFSDVICYPHRLLTLVERWIASGNARRIVCSVKFQGETDFGVLAGFAAIPGSRLMHLHHNKHELTWMKLS